MGSRRLAWVVAALGAIVGCAPRGFDLPETDAGDPVPADAITLSVIHLNDGAALVVHDPRVDGGSEGEPRRTKVPGADDLASRLQSLALHEVVAAMERRRGSDPITLLLRLDHHAYLPGLMEVLVDPARAIDEDHRLRVLLAVEHESARGLPLPERLDVVGWQHLRTTWSLWIDDRMHSSTTLICTRPDRHSELDPVPCTALEDPRRPLAERSRPDDTDAAPTPAFVQRLCDHLDEPFDLHWSGDSVEALVTLLADDPRPPRCRGKTWITRGLRHGSQRVTIEGLEAWRASRPIASW